MIQTYFTLEKPRDLNELWTPNVILPVINESSKCSHAYDIKPFKIKQLHPKKKAKILSPKD